MQTKDHAHFYIVLVKAWVEKKGKFLLAKRGDKELQKPGSWAPPGGKVDLKDESHVLSKTLKKEVLEETGITITNKIELVYNNSFTRVDEAQVVNLTFLCHWQSGEAKPLEDTAEIRWFSAEELKNFPEAEDFLKIEIRELLRYLQKSAA